MKEDVLGCLASIYRSLLLLYPAQFRQEFGTEMAVVFDQRIEDAADAGGWAVTAVCLHELKDTPQALAGAYRYDWVARWRSAVYQLRYSVSALDLPPPPPDGRRSWLHAGLELSLFLLTGAMLLAVTYLPGQSLPAGWQRDLGFLTRVITPLALPPLLLGVARGLPRWSYPYGGLLLGLYALRAYEARLLPMLAALLLAYVIVAAIALIGNPQRLPLPVPVLRIGQSVMLDWTRLSFAVYGASPLALIMAFDDGFADSRTPYLALGVLAMVTCALIYCRSHRRGAQLGALLAGMTLLIWAGWLDRLAFAALVDYRIALPYPGRPALLWMLALWAAWTVLLLAPLLLRTAGRGLTLKPASQRSERTP